MNKLRYPCQINQNDEMLKDINIFMNLDLAAYFV